MLSSKSKSGLSDASINKGPPGTPSTPRASKFGRAASTKHDTDSPSPQQAARLSIDRSPRSVDAVNRRSPRISTPDKQSRTVMGSDLQTQLAAVQEELKKAKGRLEIVEKEKAVIVEELRGAKAAADETNEKLQDALVAQRIAEEASEIDKFRADELEQAGIDAVQKKEEEWQKELQTVRDQHGLDVAALLATTKELQRVQHELAMTTEAKNTALSHADDAMKIAEINADKLDLLSGEVNRLKALLDSSIESKSSEDQELVKKSLDLQGQLSAAQEDLKKANEKLISMEKEKIQVLEEFKDVKKLAETTSEKLKEKLDALKNVEETAEMYKLRASELEQENVKAAQKREEEWQNEIENLKVQHATDIAAFLSTKEELEQLKHELAMAAKAKDEALSHADDAMNIAEVNAEKIKLLTEDVNHQKALVESMKELEIEVVALRDSLGKAKEDGPKLLEMEELVNQLRAEINDAKKAESEVGQQLEEQKRITQLLEVQVADATKSNESTQNSLASVAKQLEDRNAALQDKECEIVALTGKVQMLVVEISSHKAEIDESHKHLEAAQNKVSEMEKTIEGLKFELRSLEEEKLQALDKKKVDASTIESLTEAKNKLIVELQAAKSDAENNMAAMDHLAHALHEVSTKARDVQERFLVKQTEVETAHAQIEELELKVEKMKEHYEAMLKESKKEISSHQISIERFEVEVEKLRSEWISKEVEFASAIRRSEEEVSTIKGEMNGIIESLNAAELQLQLAKEEVQRLNSLKDLEFEIAIVKESAEAAKSEVLKLKDLLLEKENELQSIVRENEDLRVREADSLNKAKELSSLLDEGVAKNSTEICELHTAEKSSDMKNSAPTSLENAHSDAEVETTNSGQVPVNNDKENNVVKENCNVSTVQEEQQLNGEGKIGENGKVVEQDLSVERVHDTESIDDEVETTRLDGSSIDQTNGSSIDQTNGSASVGIGNAANSPTKQQKKKKGFVKKVSSLLKKKNNHK